MVPERRALSGPLLVQPEAAPGREDPEDLWPGPLLGLHQPSLPDTEQDNV